MTIAIQTQFVVRQSTIEMEGEGEEILARDVVVCPSCSFLDVDAAPLYMLFVYPP